MLLIAAGPADPEVGPGRLIALGVAVLLCYLFWRFDPKRERDPVEADPSPEEEAPVSSQRDVQVRRVSSRVSRRASAREGDPPPDQHFSWGSIGYDAKGVGRRALAQARHIAATGNSLPVDGPPAQAVPDDDVDLALVDEEPEHDELETRTDFVARCLDEGVPRKRIVAALIEHYGMSRAQAYRTVPK